LGAINRYHGFGNFLELLVVIRKLFSLSVSAVSCAMNAQFVFIIMLGNASAKGYRTCFFPALSGLVLLTEYIVTA